MRAEPYQLRLATLFNQLTIEEDTMSTKRLLAMLNKLGKDAEKHIECLNSGGCAVFAAHVGYHLKYRAGLTDVVLRVGHSYADDEEDIVPIDEARNNLHPNANAHEWNCAGLCFGHVILEFKTGKTKPVWRHYDSSGVTDVSNVTNNFGFLLHPGEMTVEEGLAIAADQAGWTERFDRDQIPTLIRLIDKHFSDYEAHR